MSLVRNLEKSLPASPAGWCTPCRDGLPWSVKGPGALERGEGQPGISNPGAAGRFLGPGKTSCAHAPCSRTVTERIKYFRYEFEAGQTPVQQYPSDQGIQPNLLNERW
ncbi:NADH-ubiquinone oxidoreductase-F iron-sulfur binding region domain-containing protein [Shigella flexneri]